MREINYDDKGTTIKATAPEVVLGNGMAKIFGRDLGKATLLPGDVVEIGPRRWYVAGIMKESNSSFASEIWALDTHVQVSAAVLTFFMGAVGGFIPSVSAMRLKPLESLR